MICQGRTRVSGQPWGGARDFSPLHERPDRPWSPPSLAFNGYRGSFRGQRDWSLKLTTHLHLEIKNKWSYTLTSCVGLDCKHEFSIISDITKNLGQIRGARDKGNERNFRLFITASRCNEQQGRGKSVPLKARGSQGVPGR